MAEGGPQNSYSWTWKARNELCQCCARRWRGFPRLIVSALRNFGHRGGDSAALDQASGATRGNQDGDLLRTYRGGFRSLGENYGKDSNVIYATNGSAEGPRLLRICDFLFYG